MGTQTVCIYIYMHENAIRTSGLRAGSPYEIERKTWFFAPALRGIESPIWYKVQDQQYLLRQNQAHTTAMTSRYMKKKIYRRVTSREPAIQKSRTRWVRRSYSGARKTIAANRNRWRSSIYRSTETGNDQAFAYQANLVYLASADIIFDTKVLNALIERRCINLDELLSTAKSVCGIVILQHNNWKLFGVVINPYFSDKAHTDITSSLTPSNF